mmetsp:Transcript_24320/g.79341  ORF Transcript_24320/g.79341 Transcript_24320/m.79341 type:complete len:464 (+) Transcript_24320:1133-2524(+)
MVHARHAHLPRPAASRHQAHGAQGERIWRGGQDDHRRPPRHRGGDVPHARHGKRRARRHQPPRPQGGGARGEQAARAGLRSDDRGVGWVRAGLSGAQILDRGGSAAEGAHRGDDGRRGERRAGAEARGHRDRGVGRDGRGAGGGRHRAHRARAEHHHRRDGGSAQDFPADEELCGVPHRVHRAAPLLFLPRGARVPPEGVLRRGVRSGGGRRRGVARLLPASRHWHRYHHYPQRRHHHLDRVRQRRGVDQARKVEPQGALPHLLRHRARGALELARDARDGAQQPRAGQPPRAARDRRAHVRPGADDDVPQNLPLRLLLRLQLALQKLVVVAPPVVARLRSLRRRHARRHAPLALVALRERHGGHLRAAHRLYLGVRRRVVRRPGRRQGARVPPPREVQVARNHARHRRKGALRQRQRPRQRQRQRRTTRRSRHRDAQARRRPRPLPRAPLPEAVQPLMIYRR